MEKIKKLNWHGFIIAFFLCFSASLIGGGSVSGLDSYIISSFIGFPVSLFILMHKHAEVQ